MSSRSATHLALALLGASLFSTGALAAPVFHVDVTDDAPDAAPGDGVCSIVANPGMDEAVCTLRAAIMEANKVTMPGERAEIYLLPGVTYTLGIPRLGELVDAASGNLDLLRPAFVGVPETATAVAVIDGGGLDTVFRIGPGASGSELFGIEITNGNADATAVSAIEVVEADVSLRKLDIHGNRHSGVACVVRNTFGFLLLEETSIRDTVALGGSGRALCVSEGATARISRSAIHGSHGDAIVALGGTAVEVFSSTLSTEVGYAIRARNASVDVRYSTLRSGQDSQLMTFEVGSGKAGSLSFYGTALMSFGEELLEDGCMVDVEDGGSASMSTAWTLTNAPSCLVDAADATSGFEPDLGLSDLTDAGGETSSFPPLADSVLIDRLPAGACFDAPIDQRGRPRPVGYFDEALPMCDVGAVELEAPPQIFSDGFES